MATKGPGAYSRLKFLIATVAVCACLATSALAHTPSRQTAGNHSPATDGSVFSHASGTPTDTPALTSIRPRSGQQGQKGVSVTITAQCTHFSQGVTTVSLGAGITVASLTVNSPISVTAVLNISVTATTGARTVTVSTGEEVASRGNGFTVNAGTPILLSVNPNTGQQAQRNLSVSLTGQFTHFARGKTTAKFGSGVKVVALKVNSFTSATAILNVDTAATIGPRDVTLVTEPGSKHDLAYSVKPDCISKEETVTLQNGFMVTAKRAPSLTQISPGSGQQARQGLSVVITGQYTHFSQGATTATFGAGVTVASLTVNSPTSATAVLNISASAAMGLRTVTLTTGSEVASLANGFTVNAGTPILLSVNPNSEQQGQQNISVSLAGQFTHFTLGTTTVSFGPGITVASLMVNSPTSATAVLNIDPAAVTGARTVTLTTGSEVVTLANGFTVTPGTPLLLAVNPNSGHQGQQNLSVALTGQFTNWVQGTTTASFGSGVTVALLTVSSSTSATAVLNIDPAAVTGARSVTLTTASEVETLSNGFTIGTGSPTLLSVNPNIGQQGQQNLSVSINGQFTHFLQGASQATFGGGITVVSLTVNSPTTATVVFNIDPAAATGARPVTLTTGTEVTALSNGFTVTSSTPIMISVSPSSGQQGQQNLYVGITGQLSHFLQGATQVTFGTGVTVASLTVNSPTSATAILNIDPAATGARTVTLSTGSEVGTLSNGFTVTAGTALLLSVNPSSGQQGQQSLPVIITGQFSHFLQGSSQVSFGAGITVGSLTVNSPTTATAVLSIDPSASAAARTVTLATGAEVESLNNGFTVTASAPILLSVSPNSGQQGQQSLPVIIIGQFSHFLQSPSQVSFGAGITVASLTINSPTSAAAVLNIDYSATPGVRTVTLATGTEVVSLTNGFAVTALAPALLPVNPNSGLQGAQNLSVAITGQSTHFLQGITTAGFGAGITVTSLTVNSPTSATAVLNVDAAAAVGLRTVTVSTGSEVESLSNGFTVTSPSIGITATPNPVVFGDVPVTKSSTQIVTLSSSGSNPLTVSSITIAGAFFTLKSLPSLPLVLPPSATAAFNATFSPLGTLSSTATITIVSNAASSPTVVFVSGHGIPPDQPPVAAITVATDQPVYHRAQPVQISGTVTSSSGAAISNVPVALRISVNGTSRVLNPYTDAQGNYRAVFHPTATDGGTFSVTATATADGATQTATTNFRIFGFLVNPGSPMQDLVMGTSFSLPLNLQNIGDAALNNLTYSVTVTPTGALTATFNQTAPTLAPSAPVTVPLSVTAPSGNPPSAPATVQISITASDSVSGALDPETSTVIINLRPAVSTLTLNPTSLNVGVNPGASLTRRFAVQNNGFISSNNSTVTLQDPATFYWVSFGGADLGDVAPGTSKQFQVFINPPSNLALGNYTVLFNVSGGTNALLGTINISVTQSTLGAVAFVVSDDTGSKVSDATVTVYNSTTKKVFQGVTASDGTDTISGVDAGDYNYVVAAPLHDPGTGKVTVTANTTTQVNVLLSYNVVTLSFTVIPTSIVDQYSVALNITYNTKLPKPALKVVPPNLNFSFFPADVPGGTVPCSLSITNTSSTAEVSNVTVDTSQLDVAQPSGQQIHVYFPDGSSLYLAGTLAPTVGTTVPCYAKADGGGVPTHGAGSIIVQGNYDFSLDGNLQQGTTATQVPVSYTRPNDLSYQAISFIYDMTDPANPVLTYDAGSFVYTITSERPTTLNLLNPSAPAFNGHNLAAFVGAVGATNSVNEINSNQGTVFWHTDFSNSKTSLLGTGDTATYDISTLDNGLTLLQALQAQLAANPTQVLTQPMYLGFEGQWSDRSVPNGYLVPLNILILTAGTTTEALPTKSQELPCLNPEDPGCQIQDLLPPDLIDGQLQLTMGQKIRLERQAFDAGLGIGALTTLSNTVASVQIYDANGNDASSNFFVVVTSDPLGATHGGTVSGQTTVSWQLIPNAGAGGTSPQGTQYQVQATLSYVINGTTKTKTTQFVAITVFPGPQLHVAYTAPFVVVDNKDVKFRVTVQNVGYGPANNLTIQSAQPEVVTTVSVDNSVPKVVVDFNITGSSNTADSSGFIPGNLTINFGNVAPGATVSGYWTMQFSRRGFLSNFNSTFTHDDYHGIQLDPLVLPPTTSLIPAIGGIVTNNLGQVVPNLTAALSLGGNPVNSDQTSVTGEYYIQDLAAGTYLEQIQDISGNVSASQNVVVLANQPTNFVDLSVGSTIVKGSATITLDTASLSRTYDGNPKTVTATTAPAGLAVSFTYNGSSTAPTTAGSYSVVATISDPNYQGTANGRLTINQVAPVITWPPPAPILYGTALSGTQLDATAAVGGSVISSSNPAAILARTALSNSAASVYNLGMLAAPNSAGQLTPNSSSGASSSNAPVGSNLAYAAPDGSGRYQIWTVQTDPAAQPIQQTFGGGGSQESREPSWSDVNGMIAYQFGDPGHRAIFVMKPNLDPHGIPSISYRITPGFPFACGTDERDPAWSPDGNYLAYSCFVTDYTQPVPVGSYQIWVHDNRGFGAGRDFPLVAPFDGTLLLSPAWSPDGQSIAVTKAKQGVKGAEIAEVRVASGTGIAVPLTTGGQTNFDPTWSPAGNKIAFSSTQGGGHNIFTIDVTCLREASCFPSAPVNWTPVTTGSSDTNPAWFRSGSLLSFVSNRKGTSQIFTVDTLNPEPSGSAQPTSLSGDDPSWGSSNLFGIDISDCGSQCNTVPWQALIDAGQQFVIAQIWYATAHGGYSLTRNYPPGLGNTSGLSKLKDARTWGLRTAAYIELSYYPSNYPVVGAQQANGVQQIDSATQVRNALDPLKYVADPLVPSKTLLQTLSFVVVAVEGAKGYPFSPDATGITQAVRREWAVQAVDEIAKIAQENSTGLRTIIYTRYLPTDSTVDWNHIVGCPPAFQPPLDSSQQAAWSSFISPLTFQPPSCNFLGQPPLPLWDADPVNPTDPGSSTLGDNFTGRYPLGPWTNRLGRQYCIDTACPTYLKLNVGLDLDVFDRSLFPGPPPSPGASTPAGTGTTVRPIDPNTGASPVTLIFDSVSQAGLSALAIFGVGPQSPIGWIPGGPAVFYDVTTTAVYGGLIQVCIDFSGTSFINPLNIGLFHMESNVWVNRTGSLNTSTSTICGSVTSLSPFAIFEQSSSPPPPITGNFAYTPQAGSVLGAGNQTLSVTFTPSDTTNYATATASVPLQVTQATATVTLDPTSLTQAYDGTPKSATVTTSPASLSTSLTYTLNGGTVAAPTNVGTYAVTATITDPNYQGTATGTLTISGLAGCVAPPSGLVSWWTGDGTINDLLSVNNPSASNAVTFVPGGVGTAFTFGSGGYIDIPASPSLANQQFTWWAWARPDGSGPTNDSFGSVIVGQDIDATHTSSQLLWRATDNRFLFLFGDTSSELIVSTDSFVAGQFYLVTGTYDGTTFKLFVNGNLEGQFVEAKTIAYSSLTWTIGSTDSTLRGSVPRTWNGVIDEVQAFSRALSQSEIQVDYVAGSAGECKAQPGITSISPNNAQQGQQNVSLTLTGQFTNWVQGTTTVGFGSGITVVSLTVNSATSATAVLNVDPAAAIGARTVTLTTGAEIDILPNGFTVAPGTPIVLSVNPSTSLQGQQNVSIALTGQYTNWQQGTTTATFGPGITVASLTVNSTTSATAVVNIDPTAPIATNAVTLTTGSEVVTLSNGFAVTAGLPLLLSVNPNGGQQGQHLSAVNITGLFTHFMPGVTTASFGPGISVASLTVTSSISATAVLNIDAAAATGVRSVTLTTGSEIVTLATGFAVTPGTLTQVSVTPASGQQGAQSLSVTMTGQFTNWVQGTTTANFGVGITVVSLTVNSPTNATAVLNVSASASTGARSVSLTTGSEVDTLASGFTVAQGTPVLLTVNPTTGQPGQQNFSVVLTGQYTNWVQGTTTASFGAGITVASLTVSSSTSAMASLNIDPAASTGARTVTLTTGTEIDTLANGFTVTPPSPLLVSVSPASAQAGQQNLSVTLTGQFTHWVQGATVASFGPGISVASLTVSSATSATAVINISPGAALGTSAVTTTTGTEVATLNNAFTVTAGTPALTSVNPNIGQQGQQNLSVALTGQFTNWVQGTTTASFGSGITVSLLAISSSTSATAVLNIDSAAATGARTVTLTTGTEIDALTNGFAVITSTPVLLSVTPNSGQQGQQNLAVELVGQFTNWVQGTTTASFNTGITVSSLTVNSPTSATAVLNIDPAAPSIAGDVTLTTSTEIDTLTNGFKVTGQAVVMEADGVSFSVLNLGGENGNQPAPHEADALAFSVLNLGGENGTQPAAHEVDGSPFSVLNLAGVSGGNPVSMESNAPVFSVLNTGGSGGGGGGQTASFGADGFLFSVLNLAGVSGNQPVDMEVDGIPFGVLNGSGLMQLPQDNNPVKKKTRPRKNLPASNPASTGSNTQRSGGTNSSSSTEQDNLQHRK